VEQEAFVTIARVRRPQGRRGEVIAELATDFPERFENLASVFLLGREGQRREAQLEGHWFHKGGVVLKFAGVDDIDAAGELRGCQVQLPLAERRPLEGAAVYWNDLAGCRVVERGSEVGTVRHLDPRAGTPLLVVDTPEGELLVPFAADICRRVDLQARVIEVELPEGLRELNK
jgi:16S rRNA processing protein RimM